MVNGGPKLPLLDPEGPGEGLFAWNSVRIGADESDHKT